MIAKMNHVALRTPNEVATRNFYTRVLGMLVDSRRPDFLFNGFWLRADMPDSGALIHVMSGRDAQVADGSIPGGSGAVHHVAFHAKGYEPLLQRLRHHQLPWREYRVPSMGLLQVFVYDPHGLLIEMTFESAAEGGIHPPLDPALEFDPSDQGWWDPARYATFGD